MGKALSDDQVSSMEEAFTLFDADRAGKISKRIVETEEPKNRYPYPLPTGSNPSQFIRLATAAQRRVDPSPAKTESHIAGLQSKICFYRKEEVQERARPYLNRICSIGSYLCILEF
ncbi:hypothetical protein Salat_0795500 [Sesamum alatum]|uniref:EF-hand domain-containing protein n=1 Tax=Sesamum alatum TaxID=300844 RepID=A0AAE1YV58_9LAMI|nr:hypothetical protein Salat_0795500 [Sesamum alatum]